MKYLTCFRRVVGHAGLATGLITSLTLTGCGGSSKSASKMAIGEKAAPSASSTASHSMAGMPIVEAGGPDKSASGFTFALQGTALSAGSLRFQIKGPDGKPVTAYEPDQTKLMHLFLIRSDLTGYQHQYPTMAPDGTWTAPVAIPQPGRYRAYVSFIAKAGDGKATPLILSDTVTMPGSSSTAALPAPSRKATVDGYTATLSGEAMAGRQHALTVTVSKGGKPVTNLQPYLGTWANLTAFHQGDLAFTHLHPETTATAGPKLAFNAMFPRAGTYRLFLQFQTGGVLHTAAFTLAIH